MGEKSKIEWTDATFNPWWGCEKVSPGCAHCYAESMAKRTGHEVWGPDKGRRFFKEAHWKEPLKWNEEALEQGVRKRVFCASMADVFEKRESLNEEREKLWTLIEQTPNLDWLLLTKRPELMRILTPARWHKAWPVNAWAMTSAENQEQLDKRMHHLLQVPAHVRGLSIEPQLGPVTLSLMGTVPASWGMGYASVSDLLSWVIVGGESGPGCRPFKVEWAEQLRKECEGTNTAFFMKQLGGSPYKRDKLEDFPLSLRVREFPR